MKLKQLLPGRRCPLFAFRGTGAKNTASGGGLPRSGAQGLGADRELIPQLPKANRPDLLVSLWSMFSQGSRGSLGQLSSLCVPFGFLVGAMGMCCLGGSLFGLAFRERCSKGQSSFCGSPYFGTPSMKVLVTCWFLRDSEPVCRHSCANVEPDKNEESWVYTYIYLYIYIDYIHTHTYIYIYIYIVSYVYIYIYIYLFTFLQINVDLFRGTSCGVPGRFAGEVDFPQQRDLPSYRFVLASQCGLLGYKGLERAVAHGSWCGTAAV